MKPDWTRWLSVPDAATFYAREAILQHLDDLEDLYLAERVVKRIQAGKEQTAGLDDVEARLGLAD